MSVTEMPAELSPLAENIPADIKARLTAAEARIRTEYAASLREAADRVLAAIPVKEFVLAQRDLTRSSEVHRCQHTADGDAMADAYDGLLHQLAEEHQYPPGLVEAVSSSLRGEHPAGQPLNHDAEEIAQAAV